MPQAPLRLFVEPSVVRIDLAQGDHWQGNLTITNTDNHPRQYRLRVVPYERVNEGAFIPVLNAQPQTNSTDILDWIKIEHEIVTVPASASKTLIFSLAIPPTATPGEYRAAILVGVTGVGGAGPGASVETASYVASGLSLHLRGEAREQGFLRQFSSARSVYLARPALLKLIFANQGTVALTAHGVLELGSDFVGVSSNERVPLTFVSIPPGKYAQLEIEWHPREPLAFGPYTARVQIFYNNKDGLEQLNDEVSFWLFPTSVLFMGAFLASAIGAAIWLGLRQRN